MVEVRDYTMKFSSDMACRRQVSLRRNKPLKGHVVGRSDDLLRSEIHG
jgi:hypothetical protein